jgi:hypothetical protein
MEFFDEFQFARPQAIFGGYPRAGVRLDFLGGLDFISSERGLARERTEVSVGESGA